MKKLDWYIIRKFVGTFFYAIILLAVIACVIDYSEKVDAFVRSKAPWSAILGYYRDFVPHISALLYPLFIFIACIFFTSKLAYKSEIIAMLATGASFNRFLRPYIIGAAFLGCLSLLINHIIVPTANKSRLRFEDRYYHEKVVFADEHVHMQLSDNLLVYVGSYDFPNNMGQVFTSERKNGTEMTEKIFAERISYDSSKKIWTLYNATIRKNNGLKEELKMLPELKQRYPFTPKDLKQDDDIKEALTTPELNRFIAKQKLHGNENLNVYYVERDRRSAQPFAGLILTIIGACLASRKIRGGSGFHLALGIAISALYIMAMQLSTTFSTKSGLNPMTAVWIPNIIFGAFAFYMYRRQTR